MSAAEAGEVKHEIIIVRRAHSDHDEGHHGGVWKIAFADFMTAMMCFFLVMWLINASNEQTKVSVASYFNPVKLIDRNSSRKGLEDIGDGPNAVGMEAEIPEKAETRAGSEGQARGGSENEASASETSDEKMSSDEHLFADPYAVLAEIVAETGDKQNISEKGDGGALGAGFRGVEKAAAVEPEIVTPQPEPRPEAVEVSAPQPGALASPSPEAETAAREIREALAKAFEPGEKFADEITVVATEDGVTISVTDALDFGMFEVGSAVPRRDLVLAMEKIARALGAHSGAVTISGHTDGRPFRSEAYDNWRLSTARAHSAYYMLARAGLDEKRVTQVGGFADRRLKDAQDPLASSNRRIEILLDTDG